MKKIIQISFFITLEIILISGTIDLNNLFNYADQLKNQTTEPIKDHREMGYRGTNGNSNFQDMINVLSATTYYPTLFTNAFGDATITEQRISKALLTNNFTYIIQTATIPQFGEDIITTVAQRTNGRFNCASCHRAPEFDTQSLKNGFDRPLNGNTLTQREFTNTRSATLRDIMNLNGIINSSIFHGGTTTDLGGEILANYQNY